MESNEPCLSLDMLSFLVAYEANVIETSQQRFTSDVVPVFKIVSIFICIVICKRQSKIFNNPLLLDLGWHYYRDPKHRHKNEIHDHSLAEVQSRMLEFRK